MMRLSSIVKKGKFMDFLDNLVSVCILIVAFILFAPILLLGFIFGEEKS